MNHTLEDGTRARLLRAASAVFSRRGLKNATVREICDLAKANVAAINYYFSGKDKLFVCVMKSYLDEKESQHPIDEGITETSSTKDILRSFVRSTLFLLVDSDDPVHRGLGKILAHEFMEPTDIHDELIGNNFAPKFEYLKDVILRIYPECDEHFAMRASAAIIGQCLLVAYASGLPIKIGNSHVLTANNLDQMSTFIVEFSLGGLARLNKLWVEAGQKSYDAASFGQSQPKDSLTVREGK